MCNCPQWPTWQPFWADAWSGLSSTRPNTKPLFSHGRSGITRLKPERSVREEVEGGDSLRPLYFCSGVDRVVHASGDLDDCRPGSLLCRFVTDMRLLHCLDRSGHLLGS